MATSKKTAAPPAAAAKPAEPAAKAKPRPKGKGAGAFAPPAEGPLGQVFGIRHLSPMGAWHLQRFIAQVDPTAILIEGPSDADAMLEHLAHKKTKPPVALLAFTKQRPVRSILYPLAEYSPEWVALTAGLKAKKLVRFMDLPARVFLAMDHAKRPADAAAAPAAEPTNSASLESDETRAYLDDPYEAIARLSGDPDHETWWEKHFEHTTSEDAYRHAIHEFGRGLRELRKDDARRERETLVREAYMRRVIHETIAEGHDPQKIVVVCGAFHSTALVGELPPMTDAELRDLPAADVTLTVMPYSYYRLSAQSGYGAGNHAPRYYQALWEEASSDRLGRLPARYLAELAGQMRAAGNVRSSAEVIEGVRLANALAALSGDACAPALRDLRDAAVTCLGNGEPSAIAKWQPEVEVGTSIGAVPPGVVRTSIQDDFYAQAKTLKLEDYLKDKEQVVKGRGGDEWLDRREDRFAKSRDTALRDLFRSVFFHRLDALGIGFARETTTAADRRANTFKERWVARWTPDCEINLIENALRGDTIEIAAIRKLGEDVDAAGEVGAAAVLARKAVQCALPDAMLAATRRVQELAVDDASFTSIATAVYELADLAKYGDVTQVDTRPLEPLVSQLFLRAALLAHDASRCDDDASKVVGKALEDVDAVAGTPDVKGFERWGALLATDRWYATLDALADDDGAHPFLAGLACALLMERGKVPGDVLDRRVARRISPGMDPATGAGYFKGLASRNRAVLIWNEKLWTTLAEFVESLDDAAFRRAVVVLRSAFGAFETGEVRQIATTLAKVWGGDVTEITRTLETKLDDDEAKALESDLADLDLDL